MFNLYVESPDSFGSEHGSVLATCLRQLSFKIRGTYTFSQVSSLYFLILGVLIVYTRLFRHLFLDSIV